MRLAREANALRALADEAREAAAAALGRADSERGERERLEAEMRGERHAREELATRLSQFETELTARDESTERLRAEHADALATRDAESEAKVDERVVAAEAEAAELRRSLKSARADIELLRRERDRAAGRAAVLRIEPATTPMVAEPSAHPEQDAAAPPLPLPEGEDVGPARPASAPPATNGAGRHDHGGRSGHRRATTSTSHRRRPWPAAASSPRAATGRRHRRAATPTPRTRGGPTTTRPRASASSAGARAGRAAATSRRSSPSRGRPRSARATSSRAT